MKNKIHTIGGELVTVHAKSYRPFYCEKSKRCPAFYRTALQFIIRAVDYNHPSFDFLLRLSSFATGAGLSAKQKIDADKFIDYLYTQGLWHE